jgi:hypothetical protein
MKRNYVVLCCHWRTRSSNGNGKNSIASRSSDLIHKFHQGAARDLYIRYAGSRLEPALAHAIVAGALDRSAVPAELLDHLAGLLEFYRDLQEGS